MDQPWPRDMYEFDWSMNAKCYDWRQLGFIAVWVHCKGKNDPDQDIGDSYHSMKVPELMIKDKFVEEALAGTFRREMLLASELYRDHIVQSLEDAVLLRDFD